LPAPLGPKRPVIDPVGTDKDTSFKTSRRLRANGLRRACKNGRGMVKRFWMPVISMAI